MATRESLAIREEAAQARIAKATELLVAQTGTTIPPITATEKDPFARAASLSERVADLLEGLVKVTASTEIDPDEEEQEGEDEDGDDNKDGSGESSAQSPKEPIRRSTTKRKR